MLTQQPFSFLSIPDDETFSSFYLEQQVSSCLDSGLARLADEGKQMGNAKDDKTVVSVNSANRLAFLAIHQLIEDEKAGYIYLWGAVNSGKTHLLHATCAALSERQKSVALLSLKELMKQPLEVVPIILEGLENLALVCIDDIDLIAKHSLWEEAIFDLFNRVQEVGMCKLVISAKAAPTQLNIQLPDLVSRLSWGQTYQLYPLNDEEKLLALQQRARLRGFDLSDEIAQFLVKRVDRDLRSLFTLLNKLDRAMIQEKRALTLPFVKQILNL